MFRIQGLLPVRGRRNKSSKKNREYYVSRESERKPCLV